MNGMNIYELYTTYFNDVYKFVFTLTKNKSLTDDIVQETFTRAYINLNNFRHPPNKAWLFTVSRNLFYDYLRTNNKTIDSEYNFSIIPDHKSSPEENLFKKEHIKKLHQEILNLKKNYREAIIYFYIKELSYKEAASRMKITETNFKSILFRARRKLKRSIERKDEFFED